MKNTHIEKLIVTSTSEVYGTAKVIPIDESHPKQGQSPYSASKIGADYIAESYLALENYHQAKNYYKKVISFDEENTEVLFILGKISNLLNEFLEAISLSRCNQPGIR